MTRMTEFRKSVHEVARMLPRLAVVTLLLGGVAATVSHALAATDERGGVFLVGQDLSPPNGVGFVLAVSLQRAR